MKSHKKLGTLDKHFPSRRDEVRIAVQDGVVVSVCWKDRDVGRGPSMSLYVHGDEVLRFDCFGPGSGHYHAELVQPERGRGRLYLPEVTSEAQIERAVFELTRNFDYYLSRNPERRVREAEIDAAALAKVAVEARERLLGHLATVQALAAAPEQSLRERIQSATHTGRGLEDHMDGVARLLADWGCRPALVRAGRYHAVYGNPAGRPPITSVESQELASEIGEEAERIVQLWSVVDRKAIERARAWGREPLAMRLASGGVTQVSRAEYLDLAHLHAANVLELARRTGKDPGRLEPLRPVLCPGAVARLKRRPWWRRWR